MRFQEEKLAIIGFHDDSGLGRMAADLGRLFPQAQKFLLQSSRMKGTPPPGRWREFDPTWSAERLAEEIGGFHWLIFFEAPPHARFLTTASVLGKRTYGMVMWEWLNPHTPDLEWCTWWVCSNQFGAKVLRKLGLKQTAVIPWPIDLREFPEREINGPAQMFVHNSGMVEQDDRKGFLETVAAFHAVELPGIRLIVRTQNEVQLPLHDQRITLQCDNLARREALYETGDVLVQPSKAEGLGFAILEGMAAGMPVITTDYPPMNELVKDHNFLAGTHFGKRPGVQSHYIPQAHLKKPRVASLARKIAWAARHDVGKAARANRKYVSEVHDPARVRAQWQELLCAG